MAYLVQQAYVRMVDFVPWKAKNVFANLDGQETTVRLQIIISSAETQLQIVLTTAFATSPQVIAFAKPLTLECLAKFQLQEVVCATTPVLPAIMEAFALLQPSIVFVLLDGQVLIANTLQTVTNAVRPHMTAVKVPVKSLLGTAFVRTDLTAFSAN